MTMFFPMILRNAVYSRVAKILVFCLPLGICGVIASITSHAVGEPEVKRIEEALEAHGISPTVPQLVAFLEKGWGASRTPMKLPEAPLAKSSLLIDTWQLLALHYKEVQASPVLSFRLSDLARRYAVEKFPLPIVQIVSKDAELADPGLHEAKRKELTEFLQYNGMMALALFGKPSSELLQDIRNVYNAESRPIIQVAYARTLALLGDMSVLNDLVMEAAKANSGSSVAAVQALSGLLDQSFGITPFTAIEPRKEKAEELQRWWAENSGKVRVDRDGAIRRQLQKPSLRPYPQHTLRDLLRASADKNDIKDQRGSRTAWTKIKDASDSDAKAFLKALEPIVKDKREDLDIRDQAIRWYVQMRGEKAKGTLKKLRKDPNPEVQDLARKFLATMQN